MSHPADNSSRARPRLLDQTRCGGLILRMLVGIGMLLDLLGCPEPELGSPCQHISECSQNQVCVDGFCNQVCNSIADCPADYKCWQGSCFLDHLSDAGANDQRMNTDLATGDTTPDDANAADGSQTLDAGGSMDNAQHDNELADGQLVLDGPPNADGTNGLDRANLTDTTTLPDLTTPDLTTPDLTTPDLTTPDLTTPDLTLPDLTTPDLTTPDAVWLSREQQLEITHTFDDGEVEYGWSSEWMPHGEGTTGTVYIGYSAAYGTPVWGYFRFALETAIPSASEIQHVQLILHGKATYQWDSAADVLELAAENCADAEQVASEEDRPGGTNDTSLTTTRVRWPETGGLVWNRAADNESPDLSPVLQELVDSHGGLAQGAHVQFWLLNPDPSFDAEVGVEDYSTASGTGEHARIDISWRQRP